MGGRRRSAARSRPPAARVGDPFRLRAMSCPLVGRWATTRGVREGREAAGTGAGCRRPKAACPLWRFNAPEADTAVPSGTDQQQSYDVAFSLLRLARGNFSSGPAAYTTEFLAAASRNHLALALGARFCVSKSTRTKPKRLPKPAIHSKLSIRLQ